jgi:hypothetical protein
MIPHLGFADLSRPWVSLEIWPLIGTDGHSSDRESLRAAPKPLLLRHSSEYDQFHDDMCTYDPYKRQSAQPCLILLIPPRWSRRRTVLGLSHCSPPFRKSGRREKIDCHFLLPPCKSLSLLSSFFSSYRDIPIVLCLSFFVALSFIDNSHSSGGLEPTTFFLSILFSTSSDWVTSILFVARQQ